MLKRGQSVRRSRSRWVVLTALALGMPAGHVSAFADRAPTVVAVIAHPELEVDRLSLGELRRIFLGDRQFWSGDVPVTLLVPALGTAERATLLATVYEKTEVQYRHYWIAKVFRAEVTSAPKAVASDRMAGELVRSIEGAISVVEASRIPPGVKVLSVDGKKCDEPGYPLR